MLKRFLARDRFVLSGLLITGILMVVAGVVSGRSIFDYILTQDAQTAAQSWVRAAEDHSKAGAPAATPSGGTQETGGGLIEIGERLFADIDRLFGKLAGSQASLAEDHMAHVSGAAVLDRSGRLLTANSATRPQLERRQESPAFRAAFHAAVSSGKPQLLDGDAELKGDIYDRLVLVPVTDNGQVARVYVVNADQRTAGSMMDIALMSVTTVTCLLIVMGFVVPTAIAARRIRERWNAEDKIRFLALHDSLTGLPNRAQLKERLEQATARARRHDRLMAVLCLDLDRFKDINDTLGHATGDALLETVSMRLKDCVRETDVVARIGGDEFVIVAEDLESPDHATVLARRLCDAIAEPYNVNGHEFANSVSIGIALGPAEASDGDTLLKNADLALYRAKRDGRNTFRFFEPAMDAALQERRRLEQDLRMAIPHGEMEVRYQPQYELDSGRLSGYEALLRWTHPARGEVPPAVFLPIAEETGLIASIGEWVLRTACSYATTWPDNIRLAVNLSPAQFKAQDVVALVSRILEQTGFPARRLELEVNETLLLQNGEAAVTALKRLDAMGVSLAMDDFGTGYSSLSYLTKFPVRKLKIDRSFIDRLGSNPETTAIVNGIVGLGHSLNMIITAEGVETAGQADMLKKWGCNQVQGFFYGHPNATVAGDTTRIGDGALAKDARRVA